MPCEVVELDRRADDLEQARHHAHLDAEGLDHAHDSEQCLVVRRRRRHDDSIDPMFGDQEPELREWPKHRVLVRGSG